MRYLPLTHQLVSCSADGGITVWNMETTREEVLNDYKFSINTDIVQAQIHSLVKREVFTHTPILERMIERVNGQIVSS